MDVDILYNEYDFYEEKNIIKYTKSIEKLFRSSIEYRRWVYIQNQYRVLKCPFTGITNELENGLLELHHHPITLYDICNIIIDSMLNKEINLNNVSSFQICKKVQDQHMLDLVSYVPLTKTYHDQYHITEKDSFSGELQIELKEEWIINYEKLGLLREFIEDYNL